MEIWKDIEGYEGLYQASNLGRIKSLSRVNKIKRNGIEVVIFRKEIILKPSIYDGYSKVVLTNKNGKRSTMTVHRLVAFTFLLGDKSLHVNHIDFNRSNNKLKNLELVTHLENVRHSRTNNRFPKMEIKPHHRQKLNESVQKKVICIKTGLIYNSATEAALILNIKSSTLIHYLLGTRKNKTTLQYFSQSS